MSASTPSHDDVKLSTDVERNFDISEMASWPLQEPNLELEMTFLGRGRSYYDQAERRQYEIETLSTNVSRHSSHYDVLAARLLLLILNLIKGCWLENILLPLPKWPNYSVQVPLSKSIRMFCVIFCHSCNTD